MCFKFLRIIRFTILSWNFVAFFVRHFSVLKGYCSVLLFNQISGMVQNTDNEHWLLRRCCFDYAGKMRCTMNFVMCQSNKCTLTFLSFKFLNNNLFCCNASLSLYFVYRTSFYRCIKINTNSMLCSIVMLVEHFHSVTFNSCCCVHWWRQIYRERVDRRRAHLAIGK